MWKTFVVIRKYFLSFFHFVTGFFWCFQNIVLKVKERIKKASGVLLHTDLNKAFIIVKKFLLNLNFEI